MNKIKRGYYSAIYFKKTIKILKKEKKNNIVTIQFFQYENNVKLVGINECVNIIKKYSFDAKSLKIYALTDGDVIKANEPVLKIVGNYHKFGHLENIIDGILSRQTSIATNCYRILQIINSKKIIYMNDRNDYYYNQENDGYAAYIAGITNFVTYAQISKIPKNIKPIGTIPHALIQGFNGNLIESLCAFHKIFPSDKIIALVDYNNDVINDSLKVAYKFKHLLYAVRIDTSNSLIDKYFTGKEQQYLNKTINGVSKYLILALRKKLNKHHFNYVKIIVSSGFNLQKIKEFENENIPVDIYGIGKSLSQLNINFTGDVVQLNNYNQSKFGRKNINSIRLTQK